MTEEFENDADLQIADLVHDTVSTNNTAKATIQEALATDRHTFEVPRATLESFSTIMTVNALLLMNLYEENQDMHEQIVALAKKHGIDIPTTE